MGFNFHKTLDANFKSKVCWKDYDGMNIKNWTAVLVETSLVETSVKDKNNKNVEWIILLLTFNGKFTLNSAQLIPSILSAFHW